MPDHMIQTSLVNFNNLSMAEAAQIISEAAKAKHFSYVVTPNTDHLARLVEDKGCLKSIYQGALLSLCDSRIVDKMLRLRGKTLREVIPGSSLTEYLFEKTVKPSDKVLILGVDEKYIDRLRALYPPYNIIHINPSMGFINRQDEVDALLDNIVELQPNYIFFSVGSPRQEVLAEKVSQRGGLGGVGLCVGASVLFMVGAEKRAPGFLQVLHLEWAYRMMQDPKRLVKRYMKNFTSIPAIFSKL